MSDFIQSPRFEMKGGNVGLVVEYLDEFGAVQAVVSHLSAKTAKRLHEELSQCLAVVSSCYIDPVKEKAANKILESQGIIGN